MACDCGLFGGKNKSKHVHSINCIHNKRKTKKINTNKRSNSNKRSNTNKKSKTYKARGGFRYGRSKFGRTPTPGEQLVSASRTNTGTKTRKTIK